jgi:DNA-binding MarR family transcriptional regulator
MMDGVARDPRLAQVAESIEALVMWVRRQAPTQVSTSTVTTLDTLLTAGPQRISDLAEHEALSQPGMTTLVNRLEGAGLAERVPDPTDGRATLVRITAGGRRLLADRRTERTAALLAELDGLDEAHRAMLIAALPAVDALITTNKKKVS